MKVFIAKQWLLVIFTILIFSCSKKNVNGSTTTEIPVHPLRNEQDLDILIQQIGNSRIVLLGEASHGTAEYYEWRAAISKRLILEKGFNIIAVEGDWSESYRVNQFIKGGANDSIQAVALLRQYTRWPTWMWGNYEIASLVTWLNAYNQGRGVAGKAGFYGLDVYGAWESITDLGTNLHGNDTLTQIYNQVRNCFQPYRMEMQQYGYAATGSSSCRGQTEKLWQSVLNYTGGSTANEETHFVMQQNALGILNAERYYRTSVRNFGESWNIRDRHMAQTMTRLLDHHGSNSKIVIWEHNTHVGDARYTDMAAEGMINLGQLAREQYGEDNVYIIGFGSNSGSVIAADAWGSSMRSMNLPRARNGSWEHMLHQISPADNIILSSELRQIETLKKPIGHRAIGVVYDPANERGNYVPSIIPNRYDAFIYIDKTRALRPIK